MNRIFTSLAAVGLALAVYAAEGETSVAGTPLRVIPIPVNIELEQGAFIVPEQGMTCYIEGERAEQLTGYLEQGPLKWIPVEKAGKADVVIKIADRKPRKGEAEDDRTAEGYSLQITPKRITIRAAGEAGAFYALQTLLQMTEEGRNRRLVCCTVGDRPRFAYRGLHFDVSRHFRSKEFLMKQMDAMALLKLNKMHLHLTNGTGWRLEIDRYPRLTEFAAWRPNRSWMDWCEAGTRYCEKDAPGAYGGYYTKEDIRQLLAYAEERHIQVIPEIEMPGHSEEVLTAYPELSCTGEPYRHSDFCVGKEATFTFLENVLTEVIDLFPSEYIHIGGDEAGKGSWKTCPDCQRRMKEEGLKDVDELQSYLIHRIEAFINSKGRKMIGFDEILQGGLAPNATVMSWRGTEGGIRALKSGHDVIMTPGSTCYLDYAQDAPFKEPVSIGGYSPLEKVYGYEPVEEGLTEEEAAHLLGLQGNLWSEYITEDDHAEYMYYPRAFAIAEIGWSRPEQKDYAGFRNRSLGLIDLLRAQGYTTFDLANEYGERRESLAPVTHLGKGCKVIYNLPYSPQYPAAGVTTLTDGICGGWTYGDKKWQGTLEDFDVTVDLGKVQPVHYVGATFMHSPGAWVHVPQKVEVSLSVDGKTFTPAGTAWCDIPDDVPKLLLKEYGTVCQGEARYVRVHAVKNPRPGAWLFTDEIVIN